MTQNFFNYREIWSRFLAFESEVGDLASIMKVEKRRSQAIEKVKHLIPGRQKFRPFNKI